MAAAAGIETTGFPQAPAQQANRSQETVLACASARQGMGPVPGRQWSGETWQEFESFLPDGIRPDIGQI